MNDQELLNLLKKGGSIAVPYFNHQEIEVLDDHEMLEGSLEAFKTFLNLSNQQRLSDGRHLVAHCQFLVDIIGKELLDGMGGVEPTLENVWDYVTIAHIFFSKLDPGKYVSKPTVYVQIEGEIAWGTGHGLQMSWEDGRKLVKVSEYDGHPTNGHASAKPEHDKYVFYCYQPEFCTLSDPI